MAFGLMRVVIEDSPASMQGLSHAPAQKGQGGDKSRVKGHLVPLPTKVVKSKGLKEGGMGLAHTVLFLLILSSFPMGSLLGDDTFLLFLFGPQSPSKITSSPFHFLLRPSRALICKLVFQAGDLERNGHQGGRELCGCCKQGWERLS